MRKGVCLVIMLLALLSGCSVQPEQQAQSEAYKIGVLLKSIDSQHWLDVQSGVRDAARELGAEVIILYPQAENAIAEQKAMFYDLLESGPDVILFAPCDSGSTAPMIAAAEEKGVPVLAIDTRTEDIALPYIGSDNGYMGVLAAQQLAKLMQGEGKVAIISGVREQASHRDRIEGFKRAVAEYSLVDIVEIINADSQFAPAMQAAHTIIEAHPDVAGIFCTNAVMGLGAVEQKKIGFYASDPYIVAVDTQDDALSAVENGTLHGLVSQDGYEVGYKAVQRAVQLLSGEEIPAQTFIRTIMLTKENVGAFVEERLAGQGEVYD